MDGWVAGASDAADAIAGVAGGVDDGIVAAANGGAEADCDANGVVDGVADAACDALAGASLRVVVVVVVESSRLIDAVGGAVVESSGVFPHRLRMCPQQVAWETWTTKNWAFSNRQACVPYAATSQCHYRF